MRIQPITTESFQHDAVVSQRAANEGVWANAWDHVEAFRLRRYHPPLLSYVILLNNGIVGRSAFAARIFSIIFGSLTCLTVAVSLLVLLRHCAERLLWAVFGAWMLCLLPVHLYVSRSANWDALYGFFVMATLLCLSIYVVKPTRWRLTAAGMFAGLGFLVSELGLALLPAVAFVFVWDTRRAPAGGD